MFFRRFRKCFRRLFEVFHLSFFMLQLLHLDVSKVDRVLNMKYVWEAAGGADNFRGGVSDVHGHAGPTAGALDCEPNALGARSLFVQVASER
jgi:hypothetical protein